MRINNNLMAMNTHRQLGLNASAGSKSIEKLSSGFRINRAGDDAAGLAISEKMRAQIRGLSQASRNSQDAISLVQTAEGALNETHAILQRMRELSVQSANDTNVTTDRDALNNEITQLKTEIDRIANTTEFNTRKLLNGDLSTGTTEQAQILSLSAGTIKESGGTVITATANLTGLEDVNGNNLGLASTDIISIKGTLNGSVVCATVTVGAGSTTLTDLATALDGLFAGAVISPSGQFSITTTTGETAAIGALTITAKSASGAERTAFNNAFGNLTETQTAADNSNDGSATMQIGANQGQTLSLDINKMNANALGVNAVNVSTSTAAQVSITAVNEALNDVSTERAKLGAVQNRLEHTIKNLDTSAENLQASESRIRDVDMAKEMMSFTKNNILQQAAQAMLAQANQAPQGVLQLLR
jgi:flagellin